MYKCKQEVQLKKKNKINRFATRFEIFLFGGYFVKVYKVFAVGAYSLGEKRSGPTEDRRLSSFSESLSAFAAVQAAYFQPEPFSPDPFARFQNTK